MGKRSLAVVFGACLMGDMDSRAWVFNPCISEFLSAYQNICDCREEWRKLKKRAAPEGAPDGEKEAIQKPLSRYRRRRARVSRESEVSRLASTEHFEADSNSTDSSIDKAPAKAVAKPVSPKRKRRGWH
jgi:hypothetical protein